MAEFGVEDFAREIHVPRETIERLQALAALLQQWQPRINLVSNDSLPHLWRRHMLDSAQLYAHLPKKSMLTLLDMGSGAGFPGLVLAAMAEGQISMATHLVESDSRKCAFLRAAAREMGIADHITVHNSRLEQLETFQADVITARALAELAQLFNWGARFAKVDSRWLLLKGSAYEEELTAARAWPNMRLRKIPSISDKSGIILIVEGVSVNDR